MATCTRCGEVFLSENGHLCYGTGGRYHSSVKVNTETAQYQEYRRRVIEACVHLMGEHNREFFTEQCSWEEPFSEGRDPDEVANDEFESLS